MSESAEPRFIVIEGIDGCGKSTQIARVSKGRNWIVTREPGGTPLGLEIRSLLLHADQEPTPLAEALLMAADRAHHVETVIRPALESGQTVLSDRHAASTIAYQGWGHEGDVEQLERINAIATGGLLPDLTILLDLDVEAASVRRSGDLDRLESLDVAFHERVRRGYLAQAAADPGRWKVVDASMPLERVSDAVDEALGI